MRINIRIGTCKISNLTKLEQLKSWLTQILKAIINQKNTLDFS